MQTPMTELEKKELIFKLYFQGVQNSPIFHSQYEKFLSNPQKKQLLMQKNKIKLLRQVGKYIKSTKFLNSLDLKKFQQNCENKNPIQVRMELQQRYQFQFFSFLNICRSTKFTTNVVKLKFKYEQEYYRLRKITPDHLLY